ncbi:MAG: 50S ribosomal protein L9 [Rickettsiales bacterium]|nr:50S ribosomal protein L9 [Rickettsiales bacterium]
MKVILLEKLKNLGEVGELVEVKSGYARNFLIPNRKAVFATKQNVIDFESKKAELQAQSKKREAEANKIAEKIRNKILAVIKQAGDDGRLYGAVNSSDVVAELKKETSVEIDRKNVTISTAIKFVGFYQIYIDLGEGVTAQVYVNVARGEAEAEELKNKFLAGKIKVGTAGSVNEVENKKASQITTTEANKTEETPKAE